MVTIQLPGNITATIEAGEWTSRRVSIADTLNMIEVDVTGYDPFPDMTIAQYVLSITPGASIVKAEQPDFDPQAVY